MKRLLRTGVVAALVFSVARPALADDVTAACIQAANDGQKLQRSGKFIEARALLSRCSQADCPAAIQTDCGEWSMQLGARVPSLALGVVDANGAEIVDSELTLDGKPVTAAPGLAVEMDPGVHRADARTTNGQTGTIRFVAHEGERSRKIVLRLSAPAATPTPDTERPWPLGPIAVAGGGLVLSGLGAGFVVAGATSFAHLKSTCAPTCADDVVASAKTRSIVGDVLLTTGLVALATAGIWYFLQSKQPASQKLALGPVWRF